MALGLLSQLGQPSVCSFRVSIPSRPMGSLRLGTLFRPQSSNLQSCRSISNAWRCIFGFAPPALSPALPGRQCPWLHGSTVSKLWKSCQLLHGFRKGPQNLDLGTSPSQVGRLTRVMPG